MYNRYIRNDDGVYARQPQPEPTPPPKPLSSPPPLQSEPEPSKAQASPKPKPQHTPPPKAGGQLSFLSGILDKLHLGDIDIGDLLLLLLLFHLFREDGDEELLIAIGLLLIL